MPLTLPTPICPFVDTPPARLAAELVGGWWSAAACPDRWFEALQLVATMADRKPVVLVAAR